MMVSERRLLMLREHQRRIETEDSHGRRYIVCVGRAGHGCVMLGIVAWPQPDDIIQAQADITLFLTPKQAQKIGQMIAGGGYMAEAHDELDDFNRCGRVTG